MTSISSNGWGSSIQSLLQQQVTAGTIPSGDQSALSSAISGIGNSVQSPATAGASMQTQVSSAIDSDVSSGKLTTDQATELKGLFAKAHGGGHVHHGHGGGGASALDALFSDDSTTDPTDPTSTASSSTTSTDPLASLTSTASSATDRLSGFVSTLRSAVSSNSLYGAAGSTAGRLGSMLVNSFA